MSWLKDMGNWGLSDWLGASLLIFGVLVIVLGAVGEVIGQDLLGGVPVLSELVDRLLGFVPAMIGGGS